MREMLLLTVGHFFADFPFQGDFLAKGKNHTSPIPGIPWLWCLVAHAAIHAGMVWAITGVMWLAVAELVAHAMIDYGKCDGWWGFNVDQSLHLVCKAAWVYAWKVV